MSHFNVSGARESGDEALKEYWFADDGLYPNNAHWPLLLYQLALAARGGLESPQACLALFERSGWSNGWVRQRLPFPSLPLKHARGVGGGAGDG